MKQHLTEEKQLYVLRRIAETVSYRFDPDPLLQAAVTEVGEAMGTSRCFFYQIDSLGFARITAEFVTPPATAIGVGCNIVTPVAYAARQTAKTVSCNNVYCDSRFSEAMDIQVLKELNVFSVLVTPVSDHLVMLGLLGVHQCDQPRVWSHQEEEFLETVSSLLSMCLKSCRVFAEQQVQADILAKMNEDLSRLYVELAAKDTQIGKFMHLISHDLRAPMVAIRGLVDLLKKNYDSDPVDSKPRRYLELILHSAEQVTQLTGALLEYARLGQSSLNLAQVDTDNLVRDTWQRFALGSTKSKLEIFTRLPVIRADKARVGQIFQNLIENAIKYRRPESILIVDVTCQETDDSWQFAVNDNGIGFHPCEADSLFDLFVRLKEVSTKPGTGIGLASVMEIARLHGGAAWAVGRPGNGATFHFTISKNLVERSPATQAKS